MKVAVFIDCNRFLMTGADHSFRLILEIDQIAAGRIFNIDESDMML